MTTSRFRALAALTFAFVAASCGGSDGGPTFASKADSATIATLADNAGNFAQTTLDGAFGGQSFTLGGFLLVSKGPNKTTAADRARAIVQHAIRATSFRGTPSFQAVSVPSFSAPFSTCTPTEAGIDSLGDPIDSDGDLIPDNYTANFGSACVYEDSAGTQRLTISGSLHIQDNGRGFFSYSLAMSNLSFKYEDLTLPGDFTKVAVNGTEAAQFAAALASHATNFTLNVTNKTGSTTLSESLSENESSSFDPDDTFSLALGNALPAGVFNYSSDFKVVGENSGGQVPGNFHLVLSTPTPMHYDPACLSEITAGQFRGLLNGDQNVGFTVTWSACGTSTTVIFGDTPPAVVAGR